ncbi:MAG: oxygen-dependent coproporphyrinogen oxidase [Sphingobacteriaceae bacterium]|nr:oxygen-dependent coproporphyrinogen oxidase [Sphingobacteriaceae bacterium]
MEIERTHIADWLKNLQDQICTALEQADGKAKFIEDNWKREDGSQPDRQGGGGRTRIIQNGKVIEKGGVLFSEVFGKAPEFLFKEKEHSTAEAQSNEHQFYATGVSIVIHPESPRVPIIHMNVRYFELRNKENLIVQKWLGGGIDLTPHYVVEEDAKYFHGELKKVCDKHQAEYYQAHKKWADDYFFITHRKETRGVGGIFFDRLNEGGGMSFEKNLSYWKDVGSLFAPVYCELIARNKSKSYNEQNKQWQLLRRGRYVEFNLVYDKGTKFGLESNGRVESILMSLPKTAGWEYNFSPEKTSEEEKTLSYLKKGVEWV